jgi:tRNA pseudouridine55 synthase
MIGLLNIHKPYDITSRDVVNRVQTLVRPHKAGHAGTLDPLATGVLVVCVGAATRLIECIQKRPKSYVATFLLGRESETEDVEAPMVELVNPPVPRRDDIAGKLPQFCGEILQRPPVYSALKVQGRRAYALARRGETVVLQPRPITIHRLEILHYEYPRLTLAVECGSGTYVRSLGRDIAASLGTAAVMSALVRTAIGNFTLDQACSFDQLSAETLSSYLLPPIRAIDHFPSLSLSPEQVEDMAHGRTVRGIVAADTQFAAALDDQGRLLGLLRPLQPGVWQPHCNLVAKS